MNGITRTLEEAMNVIEIDCPWCAAEATIEAGPAGTAAARFVCASCSIGIELAPDPITVVAARAA
jgi:hypothetical protein